MNSSVKSPHGWVILVAIGLCSITAGIVLTIVHGFGFGSVPPLVAGSLLAWSGIQRAIRPAAGKRSSVGSSLRRQLTKIPKEIALLMGMAIASTGLVLTVAHGFSVSLLPLLGSGTALTITSSRRFLHQGADLASSGQARR
jgi:hypothetical protein